MVLNHKVRQCNVVFNRGFMHEALAHGLLKGFRVKISDLAVSHLSGMDMSLFFGEPISRKFLDNESCSSVV